MPGSVARLGESRLESLLESAKLLNSTLDLDGLLRHLLRTVMGRLLVGRCAIAVRQPDGLRVALTRGCPAMAPGEPFTEEAARQAGLRLFFSIGDVDNPVGVLGTSAPPRGELEMEEQDFIRALLGLAASGISNAQAHQETLRGNRVLDQKVQELRALLDLVRGLASTLDPEEVAQLLVLTLAGRWAVRKYAVVTWREGHPEIARHKGFELPPTSTLREVTETLPEGMVLGPGPIAERLSFPVGSLLLPLRSGEGAFGLVVCGPRAGNQTYGETDCEFGAGLVAQAAVALENAWHFRETLGKKQLEKELSLAAAIQQGLFPAQLAKLAYSDLAARNLQAKQVGGDYYDAIPIVSPGADQPHLLCVVDISGKGMFASLLMSNIQATLRALLGPSATLPGLAVRSNDLLWASSPANRYATAIMVWYEPLTGHCKWVNCGHNDGVILRANGAVEMLPCSGLALGLFPHRTYEEQEFRLAGGDLLALYSDGVTEAQDASEREYSLERLVECLRAHRERSSSEVVDTVYADIDLFVAGAPQFDDITLLVLKRES